MDKKKKNRNSFIGVQNAGSSISPEIHKKAERIARALMNTPSNPLKSKKVN